MKSGGRREGEDRTRFNMAAAIALGAGIGAAIGAVSGNLAIGVGAGVALGAVVAAVINARRTRAIEAASRAEERTRE